MFCYVYSIRSIPTPHVIFLESFSWMRVFSILYNLHISLQAVEGQVFDRHLLGLRLLAKENGIEMPEMFTDPSYAKSLHFCLSTSQVSPV